MYPDVLSKTQKELLPLLKQFKREYYLVGGTAIALHIGHRRSIDFDLFKLTSISHKKNLIKIDNSGFPYSITRRVEEQMNLTINDVKVTFFEYPFEIPHKEKFESYITLPSLLDLGAMKAYALGRRSKWKDYVDLYFLLTQHFTIKQLSERASEIFGSLFSEKLFRAQLSYFDDVDYTESVDYLIPNSPTDEEIKNFLRDTSSIIESL
ncbi:MAG: nucleotidyl transferase AbiEii/AbiGii toxin family protein [Bacteroidales bacterium]|nr:nucleotidyl transferase AbiEii/AbiGii toxin family protein [Bacteroidales bacterium]